MSGQRMGKEYGKWHDGEVGLALMFCEYGVVWDQRYERRDTPHGHTFWLRGHDGG